MKLSVFAAAAGVTAALALPAAVAAAPADPIGLRGPGVTIVSTSKVVGARGRSAQKPKLVARPKTKTTRAAARPLLIVVRPSVAATVETGIGGADNCAAYTGCSDEEFCVIWGLRCELVPPPVGTRALREAPVS
jgi:hypothetical protein